MPKLDDQRYQKWAEMLNGLKECTDAIRGDRAQEFVKDQLSRHQQYGRNMFVSDKQYDWLANLYDEYVGHAEAEPKGVDEQISSKPEFNDEMPF